MNFDRIAPFYRALERLAFGNQLQAARVAFVREIEAPEHVLIVGEGDGRFLTEFVRAHPAASVDCIELSAVMINLVRKRSDVGRVRFVQEDITEAALPSDHYDLIVTHFVLDCFAQKQLDAVIAKAARAATSEANWLLADFHQPAGGWERRHAQCWIRSMYAFFRLTSGLETAHLTEPAPFLRAAGFAPFSRRLTRFGLITSEWWRRVP